MDWLETTLHRLAGQLARLLDPLMVGLDRLGFEIRRQLDAVGVPYGWQSWIVTGLWVVVLAMMLRTLTGWLRLVLLLMAAVVLARAYGVLPGG